MLVTRILCVYGKGRLFYVLWYLVRAQKRLRCSFAAFVKNSFSYPIRHIRSNWVERLLYKIHDTYFTLNSRAVHMVKAKLHDTESYIARYTRLNRACFIY